MVISRADVEKQVRQSMIEIAASRGSKLVDPIQPETILLESGLDSLSFAMLIASLELKLGYDPFSMSVTPFYPSTFVQLCDYYIENQPS